MRMRTCHDPIGRIIRWKQRFSKFDYEVLYRLGMVQELTDVSSRVLHLSDAGGCELIDDRIPTFESSPPALQQQLKEMRVLGTSFLDSSFRTINLLKLSYPTS